MSRTGKTKAAKELLHQPRDKCLLGTIEGIEISKRGQIATIRIVQPPRAFRTYAVLHADGKNGSQGICESDQIIRLHGNFDPDVLGQRILVSLPI